MESPGLLRVFSHDEAWSKGLSRPFLLLSVAIWLDLWSLTDWLKQWSFHFYPEELPKCSKGTRRANPLQEEFPTLRHNDHSPKFQASEYCEEFVVAGS